MSPPAMWNTKNAPAQLASRIKNRTRNKNRIAIIPLNRGYSAADSVPPQKISLYAVDPSR